MDTAYYSEESSDGIRNWERNSPAFTQRIRLSAFWKPVFFTSRGKIAKGSGSERSSTEQAWIFSRQNWNYELCRFIINFAVPVVFRHANSDVTSTPVRLQGEAPRRSYKNSHHLLVWIGNRVNLCDSALFASRYAFSYDCREKMLRKNFFFDLSQGQAAKKVATLFQKHGEFIQPAAPSIEGVRLKSRWIGC